MDTPTGRGPTGVHPPGRDPGRLDVDVQMLRDLIQRGFEVDGEAVLCERMTWAIYGRTTYDGEIILAEYQNPEDARTVIRAIVERQIGAPRPGRPGRPAH